MADIFEKKKARVCGITEEHAAKYFAFAYGEKSQWLLCNRPDVWARFEANEKAAREAQAARAALQAAAEERENPWLLVEKKHGKGSRGSRSSGLRREGDKRHGARFAGSGKSSAPGPVTFGAFLDAAEADISCRGGSRGKGRRRR